MAKERTLQETAEESARAVFEAGQSRKSEDGKELVRARLGEVTEFIKFQKEEGNKTSRRKHRARRVVMRGV